LILRKYLNLKKSPGGVIFSDRNSQKTKGDVMLKKGRKPEEGQDHAYDTIAKPASSAPKTGPSASSRPENTIIGENITIEGSIRGNEHLVIEGSMKGNVQMEGHDFRVGPRGRIEGEIKAQNVKISGQMIGNIMTKGKVEITKEADFMGDIRAKGISIEDGAYFKGSIELAQEPHRKTTLSGKSTTPATPAPVSETKTETAKKAVKEN
jgi:cytoskeletal protein CcmA (bactofilin family)